MAAPPVSFKYPTNFVRNPPKRGDEYDSALPPDRFVSIPGRGNYRSGRIHKCEQLKMLRDKYGIKRVVNLALDSMARQRGSGCSYPRSPCEPVWAEKLGMKYLPVYIGSSPPSNEKWSEIRAALAEGNTLVHCTWGVDRTGAVSGRWVRELVGLSDKALLEYTHSFGGQWRKAADPNRKLRAWMLSGRLDPQLREQIAKDPVSPLLAQLVDSSDPMVARVIAAHHKDAKENPLKVMIDHGSVVALAAVGGLAAVGSFRRLRGGRGSRAMITKYSARNEAKVRYSLTPGFRKGRILKRVKDGWLISFVDKTGQTRYTIVGGHEDERGAVHASFRAPTQHEVPR